MDRAAVCKAIDLGKTHTCPQSKYGKFAFKNNYAGLWCSAICFGEYRLYKVDDGERSWVWANSVQQIKEYWEKEFGEDLIEEITMVTYGESDKTFFNEDNGGVVKLIDVIMTEYKNTKELCVIASTAW
jgi:hypothetical protein